MTDHLTVSEAAEALHVSVPTIKRYIYEGKLKSAKLPGGQHRIPRSEIDRLLTPGGGEPAALDDAVSALAAEERLALLERWVTELQAEVERLTAALEVVSTYCARTSAEPTSHEGEGTQVLVLGPGCKRCDALYDLTVRALQASGRGDVTVERVRDLEDIAAYGPVLTPALVIDGILALSGRVPTETALRDIITRHLTAGRRDS